MDTIPDNILNKKLYLEIKEESNTKYKRPGLFRSAWIQKEYVKRGGTYSGVKPGKKAGLERWLKGEQWAQIIPYIKTGQIIQCGSSEGKNIGCRPTFRYNSKTPITLQEAIAKHGKAKVLKLAEFKEKNPDRRINWEEGKIYD